MLRFNKEQKTALRNLVVQCIGEPVVRRVGPKNKYRLEVSDRWPELDWNGESTCGVTVGDIVTRIVNYLERGTIFSEIVVEVDEYQKHFPDEWERYDKYDQVGISYARVLGALPSC